MDSPPDEFERQVGACLSRHLGAGAAPGSAGAEAARRLPDPQRFVAEAARFCATLRRANEAINLTGISDAPGMAVRHVLDSLLALPLLDGSGTVADLGSGCGVPGVPLALAQPQRRFVLIESRVRKAAALRDIVTTLGLAPRVLVAHARGEHWLADNPVDVIVTRALGDVADQLELLQPLRSQFRRLLMLKGPAADDELARALPRLPRLGFVAPQALEVLLPDDAGRRVILAFAGGR